MHRFVTEMCTYLLQNGALWDMWLVHYGICESDLLQTSDLFLPALHDQDINGIKLC